MKHVISLLAVALAFSCSLHAVIPCLPDDQRIASDSAFSEAVDDALRIGHVSKAIRCEILVTATNSRVSQASVASGLGRLSDAGLFPHVLSLVDGLDISRFGDYGDAWARSVERQYPVFAAFYRSCRSRGVIPMYGDLWRQCRESDTLGLLYGDILNSYAANDMAFTRYFDVIKSRYTSAVKRHIRATGRSFVTRDGVNPLEEYAKRLESAINAPRMSGLGALLSEVGLPETLAVPASAFLSDAEVKDVCEKILVDDMKLAAPTTVRLRCAMGTDAYNAFVKEYNEGSK